MTVSVRTLLRGLPLTVSLVWLFANSPAMFAVEAQFVLQVLLVTFLTRSIDLRTAMLALSLGIGIVAPLVTLTGTALQSIGIDVDNHAGNWLVVPVIEETLKLLPAGWLAWRASRRGQRFNGSDWLVTAAMGGAGFAIVEAAYLAHHDLVYRYGPALGPVYLFPTAWGYAGYLGHGAATAFVGLGAALAVAMRRQPSVGRWWWTAPAGAFAWITLEHGLANMFYNERFDWTLALGAGRVTPTVFLLLLVMAVGIDARRLKSTLAASPKLRRLLTLARRAVTAPAAPDARLRRLLQFCAAIRLANRVAAMEPPPAAFQEVRV